MIIVGSWNRVLSLDLCRWHPKSRAIIVAGAPPRYPCGGGRRTAAMYVPGAYLWQRGAGAIDIIVVRQQNGFFKSSPWNVRFSRLQGEVELQVNGVPALFRMLLNPNGDAYFPNPNPESDLSTNSDTNPSTNPNTNPNPSTNTNPSANPSTKPNTKSNPKTNPNLSSNPSTNPNTNPNLSTNPNTNPNLSTNPNTNPNPSTNPSTSPNTNPNPIVNPNPSANPKTNPNPSGNPKTNSSTNPITNPNPNANPSTDVSSNIKPSTNPISNINPNPSSSPSTNPDTNRTTNPSTDPDINPNPNTDPKPNHGPEWLPELKKLTSFESAEIVVDLLDTWSTGNPKQDGKKLQPSTRDVTIGKEKVGDHEKNSAEIVRDLNPTAEPYTLLEDLAVLLSQIAEENASAEEMQREIMAMKDESVSETVPTIPTSTEEATPEMVLLSVDGHVLTAPVSDGIELVSNPKIGDAETVLNSAEPLQNGLIGLENLPNAVLYSSPPSPADFYDAIAVGDSATSLSEELLEGLPQTMDSIGNSSKKNADKSNAALWTEDLEGIGNKLLSTGLEISLCRHLLQEGMGLEAASEAFSSRKVSLEEFSASGRAILASDQLVARIGSRYFPWMEVAPAIIGTLAFSTKFASHTKEGLIPVQSKEAAEGGTLVPVRSNWLSWSFPFRKPANNNLSLETPSPQFADNLSRKTGLYKYGWRSEAHLYVPTSEQLASLNLREGENKITFTVSIGVLGKQQQVDARIYLWNWNTRIVISDVDGTITKSDVLGHVMPLVGRDWSQLGVTRLFSAIKENGYEILFLSARAITQACGTRQFLLNLKQDGEMLPQGPVVISPDGLFPSLYREVIRRAPHEFKISYLKEIRELFPVDINPFYAGFGNRQTDEISYLQVGVPKGKIFIINPKGEVVVNHRVDVKSYTSLHTLVNDMFPAMSTSEQEDFNSWNYWKMPLPDIKDEIVKLRWPRKK